MKRLLTLLLFFVMNLILSASQDGPIRVLFLGQHDNELHNSDEYFPILSSALGRDAIYFDYITDVEEALGNHEYLNMFDVLLLYANHDTIAPHQWRNLKNFVEQGGGFVPIHSASWSFRNEPEFAKLVGASFKSHQSGVFTAKIKKGNHPALKDFQPFEAWDETYFHDKHNRKKRKVLMVRDAMEGDPHTKPEPWTWVRTQGKGRVFYTASGHDERVWSHPNFHQLIKGGILWAAGKTTLKNYNIFISNRASLEYEKRPNIPNYEKRPEPLPYQLPLSPEESMKYTQAPVGFSLELFASEPDVINPIYMQWDHKGRLWIAESIDYPNEIITSRKGNDRIKILEDTDGDGKSDKTTIFVDGLNIPTSFTFASGGVIVAHAPDMLFIKDTDGDDKADETRILFTGFGLQDTHAGPSNLRYGFDNWIYGTVGYSGFIGTVGGKEHNFKMGVFRFRSDGSAIEFLHQFNNNTWGLGFNESGDVFGSTANFNPSFFGGLPIFENSTKKRIRDDGFVRGALARESAKMIADSPRFYPITENIRQVDAFGKYTAGCGHAFATSSGFPEAWRNKRAFICGPTGHLLGMYDIRPKGSGYEAINAFSFLASADEWFSPVVAEIGPDGNMWVADWYNFIIQHNPIPNKERGGYDGKEGLGNAHININRDREHGRIYRVEYNMNDNRGKIPRSDSNGDLITLLSHDNFFWRITAQRLLVNNQDISVVPLLEKLVSKEDVSSIHAMWTLHGLKKLSYETHNQALISNSASLRKNAIRALGLEKKDAQMLYDSAVLADENPQVRLVAFAKLAMFKEDKERKKIATLLMDQPANKQDEWMHIALSASGAETIDDIKESNKQINGRPDVGETIFNANTAAGCARCHSIGGMGGNIGPALDGIAKRKSRDYIYTSLVNPSADLAQGFESADASPMIPMNLVLDKQELADILAFLLTLNQEKD